jgi:hypothetical protein
VISCDEIRETIFLGRQLDADGQAHVRECDLCRRQVDALRMAAEVLAAGTPPGPPPALTPRVLERARPILAQHARAPRPGAASSRLPWAIMAAVGLLPLVLIFDAYVLSTIHALLSTFMPTPLSTYIVFNLGALVALLVTLTYGAVPLLADRQARMESAG